MESIRGVSSYDRSEGMVILSGESDWGIKINGNKIKFPCKVKALQSMGIEIEADLDDITKRLLAKEFVMLGCKMRHNFEGERKSYNIEIGIVDGEVSVVEIDFSTVTDRMNKRVYMTFNGLDYTAQIKDFLKEYGQPAEVTYLLENTPNGVWREIVKSLDEIPPQYRKQALHSGYITLWYRNNSSEMEVLFAYGKLQKITVRCLQEQL